jgi:hypothetical protein
MIDANAVNTCRVVNEAHNEEEIKNEHVQAIFIGEV